MSGKSAPKRDNPAQHKRFIDMAREVEVDEREGAFGRAFDQIADKTKPSPPTQADKRLGKNRP